jgi:hypothetical protein
MDYVERYVIIGSNFIFGIIMFLDFVYCLMFVKHNVLETGTLSVPR